MLLPNPDLAAHHPRCSAVPTQFRTRARQGDHYTSGIRFLTCTSDIVASAAQTLEYFLWITKQAEFLRLRLGSSPSSVSPGLRHGVSFPDHIHIFSHRSKSLINTLVASPTADVKFQLSFLALITLTLAAADTKPLHSFGEMIPA